VNTIDSRSNGKQPNEYGSRQIDYGTGTTSSMAAMPVKPWHSHNKQFTG
jgi:hypothetical protein